jgi:hypothetical protein
MMLFEPPIIRQPHYRSSHYLHPNSSTFPILVKNLFLLCSWECVVQAAATCETEAVAINTSGCVKKKPVMKMAQMARVTVTSIK